MIKLYEPRYSPAGVYAEPDWFFVFGDNVVRRGTGGQACIRGLPNAYGVPTKWRPDRLPDSYFSDKVQCWDHCTYKLTHLHTLLFKSKNVYWPKDGIGTGLADLPNKAPGLFRYINDWKQEMFDTYG